MNFANHFLSPSMHQVSVRQWLTPLELSLLGAIWGSSFLFMRVSAKDFGPLAQVEVRLALGALVLLPFLWRTRHQFPSGLWPKILMIGMINSALPFMLFNWAAQHAPAGVSAIASALTVMFAALVGALFFGERVKASRAIALLVGFVGVVVLASGKAAGASTSWAVAAGATASLMYGIGINLARRHLSGLPPAAVACATLGSSALLLLPFALLSWPQADIPAKSWLSTIALGVLCTGLAYVLFYRLVVRIGAGRTAAVNYLVPLFGVTWSWLLLDEPLTTNMLIAAGLILSSVAISQRDAR